MYSRIKELLVDSLTYGMGKFLSQIISFFLIPVYTTYLTPEDYGITGVLGIYTIVLSVVANLGLESSIYNYMGVKGTTGRDTIDTAYFFIAGFALICTILTSWFSPYISNFLLNSPRLYFFVIISNLISFFTSLVTIPLTVMRLTRKARTVSIGTLINVIVSLVSTVCFLLVFDLGVIGVLLGNLVGSIASFVYFLTVVSIPRIGNFSLPILKELLGLSIYLFPNKLFALALPYYSQFALSEKLNLASLGLYSVAWKFCTPYNLVVGIFQQAWAPYKFQVFKTETEPKTFFAKIVSLYTAVSLFLYLVTAVLGDDLLRLMTSSSYHDASNYLPYLALIPLFNGFYFMFGTGYEFSKTQRMRPIITVSGLFCVVVTTQLLIGPFGVAGAALSVAFGWLTMAIFTYFVANNLYKIDYRWKTLAAVAGVGFSFVILASVLSNLLTDIILILCFFLILLFLCYNSESPFFEKVNLFLKSKGLL